MREKKFWTQIFVDTKFCGLKILWNQSFLPYSLEQNYFLGLKYFWTLNFVDPKIFVYPKYFLDKRILDPNKLLDQKKISWTNIFFNLNFLDLNFWTQIFFDPKSFWTQNFFGPNCFELKILPSSVPVGNCSCNWTEIGL